MPSMQSKIKDVLQEARILILGTQVLVGFGYRSALEEGFEHLPQDLKILKMIGLGLLAVTIALLLFPPAWANLVQRGRLDERLLRIGTTVMEIALLPLAAGLAIDLFVGATRVAGIKAAAAVGMGALLGAVMAWYGVETWAARHKGGRQEMDSKAEVTDTEQKVQDVLIEARMVLPGTQALLGFLLSATLMSAFEKLPASSKWIHLGSLVSVSLSIVLLMMPAAWHRIVERGESSEGFVRLAGRLVTSALVPLGLALGAEAFVVMRRVTSAALSAGIAAAFTALLIGLWFGVPVAGRVLHAARR